MRPTIVILAATLLPLAPASAQIRTQFGVMIPMRDGVRLSADIWMPAAPGRYPVLVARTPYMKTGLRLAEWAAYFARHGYVAAVQDTRGRGDSEGTFDAFFEAGKDGFDTIEWLARQPWSSGRVGMFGLSYLGSAQWLAAREHPPHLTCIAPTAPGGRWFEELPYMGGAFMPLFALNWANAVSARIDQEANADDIDWEKVLAHRPLLTADSLLGRRLPLYRAWLRHSTLDAYWRRMQVSTRDFATITIPTMTTTGWFDGDQPGSFYHWRGLMAHAPKRGQHYLIVGPWRHIEAFRGGSEKVGDTEFSKESILDMKAAHVRFFDWCLKGNGDAPDSAHVRVYVTGANVWQKFDTYPPPASAPERLYLTSSSHANTSGGDGRLTWESNESPPDAFTFDPMNPVPDDFSGWGGERSAVQQRQDVLVFTTDTLRQPLEIIGAVSVDLYAASDALDTDFTAVLSDVAPDGKARRLGPAIGIRRARYRNGYEREELLTPGKVERYRIELFDMAHRFLPGHRVRLEISSSATPIYAPNQNTGNPVATDTVWKVARQTVYHDRARPSAIVLPVVRSTSP